MTRVLVVDDEPAVRVALERALRLEAYDVELAVDGREALDRLAGGSPPDAVVLDVAMPHVDGLEVCRRLRDAGDRTPVMMLTRAMRSTTAWPGWTRAPTTTSSSRSRSRSSRRGCARCCGGPPVRTAACCGSATSCSIPSATSCTAAAAGSTSRG